MFNKRLKEIAEQARQAGNKLATSASATYQQASAAAGQIGTQPRRESSQADDDQRGALPSSRPSVRRSTEEAAEPRQPSAGPAGPGPGLSGDMQRLRQDNSQLLLEVHRLSAQLVRASVLMSC